MIREKLLLSIIVITKNDTVGLKKTLNSYTQNYLEIETIVIDGSDSIYDKKEIGNNIENIKYVKQKTNGLFAAMNEGLRMARGFYVIFMNGGDIFFNNRSLDILISIINDNRTRKPDALIFKTHVVSPKGISLGMNPPTFKISFHEWKILHLMLPWAFWPCHQSFIFKTSTHQKYHYENKILGSDQTIMKYFMTLDKVFIDITLSEVDTGGRSSIAPKDRIDYLSQLDYFKGERMYRRYLRLKVLSLAMRLPIRVNIDIYRRSRYRLLNKCLPIIIFAIRKLNSN